MNRQASGGPPQAAAPDPQACVLATLLRRERISLLLGTAPADRGWVDSVLPLLGRRAVDRAVISDDAYGALRARTAERRGRTGPAGPGDNIELVVRVDRWEPVPLAQWRAGIESALARQRVDGRLGSGPLADALPELSRQCGLRFLFLFDHFDACLAAPPQAPQTRAFADEWVRTVAGHDDCVHFMLGFDEDADDLLLRFQHRIPGLGTHWLRLGSFGDGEPRSPLDAAFARPLRPRLTRAESAAWIAGSQAGEPQERRPPAAGRGSAMRTQEVYDSVEDLLTRVSAANRRWGSPLGGCDHDPVPTLPESRVVDVVPAGEPDGLEPEPASAPGSPAEATTVPSARSGRGIGCGVALALLALAGVLALSATGPIEPPPVNATPTAPAAAERPCMQGHLGESAPVQARLAEPPPGHRPVRVLAEIAGPTPARTAPCVVRCSATTALAAHRA